MKNPKAWHTHKHTTCVRIVISSTSQQRWHTRISAQSKEWALKSYCRMILDIAFEFNAKGIGVSKYIRLSLPSWKNSACPQTTAFSLRSTFQMLFQYKYFKDLQGNNGQSLCLTNTQASRARARLFDIKFGGFKRRARARGPDKSSGRGANWSWSSLCSSYQWHR